jgi:hypothetical protein
MGKERKSICMRQFIRTDHINRVEPVSTDITQIRGQQGLISMREDIRAHRGRSIRALTVTALTTTRRVARAMDNRRRSTSSGGRNRELWWGEPHGSDKLLKGEVTP